MEQKKRVMLVFGTRPEAIKVAPLVKEFQKHTDRFETIVCVTGQHREMLDQVLHLFDIKPDYDLNIMKQGQDLYDVTARVLTGLRDVYSESKPDVVFVHGDTTTSMAAALAAFYQQIPVAHIEAGLRTHNIYSPWPEEMNRQITSRISVYNLAPTALSKENLLKEGVDESTITITGNTVIDALYLVLDKIKSDKSLQSEIKATLINSGLPGEMVEDFTSPLPNKRKLVLITGHRRENFGDGFINMCNAIKTLTEKYPEVDFVYPMHLNPNVRKPIKEIFGESVINNIHFIEPLEYLPFVYLMNQSTLVLTDSGGIQEEAPGLGKPVLVMRDTTERPEAVEAGTVKLVGTNYDLIVSETSRLLDDEEYYNTMSQANNPYGDGQACERIIEFIGER
ncbi:non-hydrolyzing UDP-N-acetylglucosamine 2-epimerase [Lascolabacillus massiliensis]|jgi:UDP-N-acetylglucosamine 2-epimerase (non-hydrolysing)|uniref:non-hydrolyzing UDP-N-acetylglucosamine 2-epimerase n=1 Tax=Lascolabacillus massiliensis TaxID=1627894 RepID=UPI0006B361AB|nr:UDP-N-acetylglucosamine 2-epimerase (non-hydrolyzing) [Lascolabacillus massiliensis]